MCPQQKRSRKAPREPSKPRLPPSRVAQRPQHSCASQITTLLHMHTCQNGSLLGLWLPSAACPSPLPALAGLHVSSLRTYSAHTPLAVTFGPGNRPHRICNPDAPAHKIPVPRPYHAHMNACIRADSAATASGPPRKASPSCSTSVPGPDKPPVRAACAAAASRAACRAAVHMPHEIFLWYYERLGTHITVDALADARHMLGAC